ncbi:catecholate siderophore receptor Fiu [Burkholderia sp. SRS-W-2-2016]|uniref:catecholate siderophore receptor Fiu n=1 Tax=Burkholderia sp. SRS-W-2-2016 TaxID=1926878 RepID=UPI00094B3A12|nr:catecholate siderophore receptor Fiu [Burkholderia sp. SRS-W-2-2016]OLL32616.1 catecholate siderophore receptor Fiu [Burkholderia sp. SRS-W-2-2016]
MAYIRSRKATPRRAAALPGTFTSTATATLLAGITLGAPLAALAQSNAASEATLPAIKVNSTAVANPYKPEMLDSPKFTQSVKDSTQNITIVPRQVMREQQATTLTEALRNVPGAGTFYAGENGSTSTGDSIYMRGIDTSNSIFIDGIRDINTTYRDMFNTEQVEVIKGPSGSDYGRSAPSGSINLVSKQPTLGNSFDASVSGGTNNYWRSTVDWNRQLNDTSAFRLNVMGHKNDVAGRDEADYQRWGVAPSLAFGLNSPTTVYLDYMHVKQNNTPDGGVPTIGLPGYSAPSSAFAALNTAPKVDTYNYYGTASDFDNSTTDMATLRIEHKIGANTVLRNTTRWQQVKQDYMLSSFMLAATSLTASNPADLSTYMMARSPNLRDSNNRLITNQTNVTSEFSTGPLRHDVSAGFELTREEQTIYGHNTPTAPAVNIYSPNSNVYLSNYGRNGANATGSTDTVAAYAFDTIEVGERWQFNGGLRWDDYHSEYTSATACGGTGRTVVACPAGSAAGTPVTTVDASKSGNLIDWKLGAMYRVTRNGNVYFNYAISQQPPGGSNFALAAAGSGNSAGRVDFAPQRAKTAELGTKWELFDKRLLATAALFRTDISNEVQLLDDGTYGQIGKKRVQGLELSAAGQITPNWSVMAGYTLQDARVDAGSAVSQDGSTLLTYTPRHAFSMWTTYQLPYGFTLGGGARYVSGLQRGTDGAVGTPDHTDPYWVVDAMASYKVSRNVSIQLNIYNLFNKSYVMSINKSGYRYFPGAPRTAIVTANLHF